MDIFTLTIWLKTGYDLISNTLSLKSLDFKSDLMQLKTG